MRFCCLAFLILSFLSFGQTEEKIRHYPSGQIKSQEYFKNGKPDSIWVRYHASGAKKTEMHFRTGKAIGTWLQWNSRGELINRLYFKEGKAYDGNWIIHYDNGSNWKKYEVTQFVSNVSLTKNGVDFRDSSFLCIDKPTSFWHQTLTQNYGFPHPFLSNGLDRLEYIPQHRPKKEIVIDRFFVNDSIKLKLDTILILTEEQKRLIQGDSFYHDGWVTKGKPGKYDTWTFSKVSGNQINQQIQISEESKLLSYWKKSKTSDYNLYIRFIKGEKELKFSKYIPTLKEKVAEKMISIFGSKRNDNNRSLDSLEFAYRRGGKIEHEKYWDQDGKPNGKWTYWHYNGKIKEFRYYKNGQPVGTWKQFNMNGKLIGKLEFDDCFALKGQWFFFDQHRHKKSKPRFKLIVEDYNGLYYRRKKNEKKFHFVEYLNNLNQFWERDSR